MELDRVDVTAVVEQGGDGVERGPDDGDHLRAAVIQRVQRAAVLRPRALKLHDLTEGIFNLEIFSATPFHFSRYCCFGCSATPQPPI